MVRILLILEIRYCLAIYGFTEYFPLCPSSRFIDVKSRRHSIRPNAARRDVLDPRLRPSGLSEPKRNVFPIDCGSISIQILKYMCHGTFQGETLSSISRGRILHILRSACFLSICHRVPASWRRFVDQFARAEPVSLASL